MKDKTFSDKKIERINASIKTVSSKCGKMRSLRMIYDINVKRWMKKYATLSKVMVKHSTPKRVEELAYLANHIAETNCKLVTLNKNIMHCWEIKYDLKYNLEVAKSRKVDER